MILTDHSPQDLTLITFTCLADKFAYPDGKVSHQHGVAILGAPDEAARKPSSWPRTTRWYAGCTSRFLNNRGIRSSRRSTGGEAVRVFTENRETIDLSVFDLIMPKMNGKQALEAIRQLQPAIKGIFVSGYAPENIRHEDLLETHMEVLYKPVSPKDLLRTVRTALDTP